MRSPFARRVVGAAAVTAAALLVGGPLRASSTQKAPTLDTLFGTKGTVRLTTTPGVVDESPLDLVEDAQGRLFVLVRRWEDTGADFARHLLARFTRQGALDATFAAGGVLDLGAWGRFVRLTRDAQGRVLVAGQTIDSSRTGIDLRVLRFTPDGLLDESFGNAGVATAAVPDKASSIIQVVVDALDRPLVAVNTYKPGLSANTYLSRVVRLTVDGAADPTFGVSGVYSDSTVLPAALRGIAADGVRCVVVGAEDEFKAYAPERIVRLDAAGAPDPTFGTAGVFRFADNSRWDGEATGIGVDAQGRVVVGGQHDPSIEDDTDAIVLRFTPSGALDTTFGGGDGIVLLDPSRGGYEWTTHFRMAPDGHGHYVTIGDLTTRNGGGAGWWLAEVPQEGGAPRVFRQRISDQVGIARTYAIAFARDGAPIVAMSYEDESWTEQDPGDDLYLARLRPTPSGPADLTVAWRKSPTQKCADAGCTVKGTLLVWNAGAQPAAKTTVRLYASDDTLLDAGDELLTELPLSALKGGVGKSPAFKARSATSLAGRRLLAVVDEAGLVAEKDETNQVAASAVVP
jgi:uncharacterized delta-60 repeat protein